MAEQTRMGAEREAARRDVLDRTAQDLKSPLAVVRASLDWLALELEGREDALDAVRDASTAAARLLLLVDDLETLANIERGRPIGTEPIEIGVVAARAVQGVRARTGTGGRGITLDANVPSPIDTAGDGRLLTRAVEALLDACAKGAPSNSCVELTARVHPRQIEIEIGLRGATAVGAAVSSLEALGSAGLGVHLAVRVANAHGGELLVVPTSTAPRTLLRLPA